MDISVSSIKFSNRSIIKASLPEGYQTSNGDKTDHIVAICNGTTMVGTAQVEGLHVHFEFEKDVHGVITEKAQAFKKALYKKFPELDPERIVWNIFYLWGTEYTYHGQGYTNPVSALNEFEPMMARNGAWLCSFRAKHAMELEFDTLASFPIYAAEGLSFDSFSDVGSIHIMITNDEKASLNITNTLALE